MKKMNECTVKNGDIKYKISNNEDEFLFVSEVGNKKNELLDDLYIFLGVDCPRVEPAKDMTKVMGRCIVEPLENNQPFSMNINLFYRFGKWATYLTNLHICRGEAARRVLKTILGIELSRGDISYINRIINDYPPKGLDEIYSNVTKKINEKRDLIVESE